jgi:hypothetical protein
MFSVDKSRTEYCDPPHQYRTPQKLSKLTPEGIHEQEANHASEQKYTDGFKCDPIKLTERMRVSGAAEKLDAISWNIALLIHIGVAKCKMIGFTHLEMVDFGLDRTVRIRLSIPYSHS